MAKFPAKTPTAKQQRIISHSITVNKKKFAQEEATKANQLAEMGETAPASTEAPKIVGLRPLRSATKVQKTKFSGMRLKTGLNKTNYALRKQEREEFKEMKRRESDLKDLLTEEKSEERRKMIQRRKQREENEKKSMIYQKITNTKKLKRLTKNQMRSVIKM